MKILVAIKQVAMLDDEFEMRDDGKDVDHDFCDYEINEWDDYSLEEALLIKENTDGECEVVVVTVGPEDAEDELRKCLASSSRASPSGSCANVSTMRRSVRVGNTRCLVDAPIAG